MKGDFSRNTFDPRKRYRGVLMQQGRAQVDADWNEQLEIEHYRTETEAKDVIGLCGVPKDSDGFRLDPLLPQGIGHSTDLAISNGRIYVDGLLCELEPTPVAVSFVNGQPKQATVSNLTVDGYAFIKGQWVEMSADDVQDKQRLRIEGVDAGQRILTFDGDVTAFQNSTRPVMRRVLTYLTQPDLPSPPFAAQPSGGEPDDPPELRPSTRFSIAYLHVWEQHVTALDDALIREKALGGPDTATRIKTVWQVELLPLELDENAQFDCQTSFPEWDALVAPASGMLNARTQAASIPSDPCLLPPSAGYRRLENQLYRVEVQKGGSRDQATFKWSRENGSVQTTIEKIEGAKLTVSDLGKDEALGFAGGNWVELVSDETELRGTPGPLALIVGIDPALRQITLNASVADLAEDQHLKLRRWDQTGNAATVDGIEMAADWIDLEGGIQAQFSEGTYRAGDYWTIPARTATTEIEWPPYGVPNTDPLPQPPRGIRHHYCRLATLKYDEVVSVRDDCRQFFPPLTRICAEDVCFDNTECQMPGAETVQDAIENLCARNDLRHHNKHLHGWGIVCGLQAHCGPDKLDDPRRHVTVRSGYAIDCEGNDIIHRADEPLDLIQMIADHEQEFPDDPLLDDGVGEVCLVLNSGDAQKPYSLEKYDPSLNSLKSLFKGTIWEDVYNDCLGELVNVFKEEIESTPEASNLAVGPAQKRLTTLFNLLIQLVNTDGRFVYLSGEKGLDDLNTEHTILKNLYEKLRVIVQSQTFCGQFDSAPFPDYPFAGLNSPVTKPPYIPTIFGKDSHTRVRVSPNGGRLVYTCGLGRMINIFDVVTNEMVAQEKFPDDAAKVRDVAFSADGKQLYACATISNSASLFAVADINGNRLNWHVPAVTCSARLVTLATISNTPNKVYAIGRGTGLYEFNLQNLTSPITPIHSFNATGHLVIAEQGSQAFAFATASDAGSSSSLYDRVLRFNLRATTSQQPLTFFLEVNEQTVFGSDDIAVAPHPAEGQKLYVVINPPSTSNNKHLRVFNKALGTTVSSGSLVDLEDDTAIRLAFNDVTKFLMLTYADRYCVRLLGANDQLVADFRQPVQVSPSSLAVGFDPVKAEQKRVYVLNNVSQTITSIPALQMQPGRQVDLTLLTDYRTAVLEAFVKLAGGLLQYLKDCLCDHLLARCPECDADDKLYLACISIKGGEVYKICNFSLRKYVKSFPTVEYWLSLVPVIPLVGRAVEAFCCAALPDIFGRLTPPRENTFGSQNLFVAVSLLQETNFGNLLSQFLKQGQKLGGQLLKDLLDCAVIDREEPPPLTNNSIVGMKVDEAARFLNQRGITVSGVEAYDPCSSLSHLLQSIFAPSRLGDGAGVNLVKAQDGTVRYYTAGATGFGARSKPVESAGAAGLISGSTGSEPSGSQLGSLRTEMSALQQEFVSSKEKFAQALAERDEAIAELRAQARDAQERLASLTEMREKTSAESIRPASKKAKKRDDSKED